MSRSYWLVPALLGCLFIAPCGVDAQGCPSAPRNVQYSDRFYRAQRYFMERSSESSAGLSVIANGVPLGGSVSSRDWATESSSLDEAQARQFISQELSTQRAQIVAECVATLCTIGSGAPSASTALAVAGVQAICEQALSPTPTPTANAPATSGFLLGPSTTTVIFTGEHETREAVIGLSNQTAGALPVQIDAIVSPDPRLRLKLLGQRSFTLPPMARRAIRVRITPNGDLGTDVQRFTVTVRAASNNQVSGSAAVVVVPSPMALMPPPELACGRFQTNAEIRCTASGRADFTSSHRNEWFSFPYTAGPSMGYAGQTECFATTTGRCVGPTVSQTEFEMTVDLDHTIGGVCGPNGSNTGGSGTLEPYWQTRMSLPPLVAGYDWQIELSAVSTASGVASYPDANAPLGQCVAKVSGQGTERILEIPRASGGRVRSAPISLQGGHYDIELRCGGIQRGCFGAPNGTRAAGQTSLSFRVEGRRVHH